MTAASLASPQQRSENIMSHDKAPRMVEGLAIGMPLELNPEFSDLREASDNIREYKEGWPHRLKAGYWKDDASIATSIADGLQLAKGEFEPLS